MLKIQAKAFFRPTQKGLHIKQSKMMLSYWQAVGKQISEEAKRLVSVHFPPASRPGQPPRRRTGRLMKSIRYGVTKDGLYLYSTNMAPYSKFLEYGTSKMQARPWARPAVRNVFAKRKMSVI